MEKYGEILDSYEPEKTGLYTAVDEYFNHPIMTKTKNTDTHSVYMCKTQCMMANVCRYIIAMCKIDNNPVDTHIKLSDIHWEILQTRTLKGKYPNVKSHGYIPQKKGPLVSVIEKIGSNDNSYSCRDFDITVTLLENKNSQAYHSKGTIINALETFNTVLVFN